MKIREFSKTTYIDLYGVWFEVVVSNSINESRNSRARIKKYGKWNVSPSNTAIATWNGNFFAIFLTHKNLTNSNIAHEVFHSTHNIIEWIGDGFSKKHHEPAAYLNGYLTKQVYKSLKSWKIRAKLG